MRHELLLDRCIPSVERQTYPAVEHIVVSDGPDAELRRKLPGSVQFHELGRHFQLFTQHWGALPRLLGTMVCHGRYIAYLDDDNEYLPEHIEKLVQELETSGCGVAFSQQWRFPGGDTMGDGTVEHGYIDVSMLIHRAELLWQVGTWRSAGYSSDWDLIERWRDGGVRFSFLPEWTSVYYHQGYRANADGAEHRPHEHH